MSDRAERHARYVEEFGIENWLAISAESRELLLAVEPSKPFNRDHVDLITGEKIRK